MNEEREKRAVRTLIVLDPISGTDTSQEDEFEQTVRTYEEEHGLKLDATLANVFDPAEAERAEMIILGRNEPGQRSPRTPDPRADALGGGPPVGARDHPVDAVVAVASNRSLKFFAVEPAERTVPPPRRRRL